MFESGLESGKRVTASVSGKGADFLRGSVKQPVLLFCIAWLLRNVSGAADIINPKEISSACTVSVPADSDIVVFTGPPPALFTGINISMLELLSITVPDVVTGGKFRIISEYLLQSIIEKGFWEFSGRLVSGYCRLWPGIE